MIVVDWLGGDGRSLARLHSSTDAVVPVVVPAPSGGGGSGEQTAFVGPTAPVGAPDRYLWVQTGLEPGGTGFTFWIEDGQA